MTGSLIDLPPPSTHEEWVAHIARLQVMKRDNPDDEGLLLAIEYAERVISEFDQLNSENAAAAK